MMTTEARDTLRATSTGALLDTLIQLTHRIHESPFRNPEHTADLRAQRDLIRAEILRRTGDQ